MKKIKLPLINILLFSLLLLPSCINDIINSDNISEETNREYSLGIPGGTIRTTIKDALEEFEIDSTILVDDDGFLYLNYKTEFEVNWPKILSLDDQTGNYSYNLASVPSTNLLKTSTGTGIAIKNSERIIFNNEPTVRIDTLVIKDANMTLTFKLPEGVVDSVIINIPQLIVNNTPFSDTLLSEFIPSPYIIKLKNALIDMDHDVKTPTGFLELKTKIILEESLGNSSFGPAEIAYSITDIVPEVAFGYFGNRIIEDEIENIEFNTFGDDLLGTFVEFKEFKIEIVSESNYGAPFKVNINDIVFKNTETLEEKNVTLDNGANVIIINPAEYAKPIIPSYKHLTIDRNNSSLEDLLQIDIFTPDKVSTHVVISTNPDGETSKNFLTNNSLIKSSIHMNIPLWFKTTKYHRRDTLQFNYNLDLEAGADSVNLSNKLKKASIYFDFNNGMPFDINLQVYFTDKEYIPIDSLYNNPEDKKLIKSALIDASSGHRIESTESHFESKIDNANLQKWKDGDVKYIIIDTHVITDDGDKFVRIAEDSFLNTTVSFSAISRIDL